MASALAVVAPDPKARAAERDGRLAEERKSDAFRDKLKALVEELRGEADKRELYRRPIESEWLRDHEQIHGYYDPETRSNFDRPERAGKSRLFMNKTREKVQVKVSTFMDMLFPSDDRNWGIGPTPVPQLSDEAEAAAIQVAGLEEQVEEGNVNAVPKLVAAKMDAERLQAILKAAADKAKLMEAEIADQLEECKFASHSRDVLEDGCTSGTGVMFGPVTDVQTKRAWKQTQNVDQGGNPTYELDYAADPRPACFRVSFWDFFPSTWATEPKESHGAYIRYSWAAHQMRQFAKVAGVDKDAVRKLLRMGPQQSSPEYYQRLRELHSVQTSPLDKCYCVWMYCGPLEPEQMRCLATAMGDGDTYDEMEEVDPLDEVNALVWFCDGELLKMSIYPFDSGDPMFSVWRYEKEPGSFWGYGIPRVMRDPQKARAAAWRMMLDHGDVAAGPQVVVDKNLIEPENGSSVIRGFKVWQAKSGKPLTTAAFQMHSITPNQGYYANIIELADQEIDEITHTPIMEMGEPGATPQSTATGTALVMTAQHRVDKRPIQNWDDDLTIPTITRMYDWNMQFSTKPHIKGDYQIAARGSSVLLIRQQNTQNLGTMITMFSGDPEFKALEAKREFARSIGYQPDQFFLTDAEAEAAAKDAPQDPALELEYAKLQDNQEQREADAARANMEHDARIQVAEINQDTTMMQVSETLNVKIEELQAKMTANRENIRSKERTVATETAIRSSEKDPLNKTQIANT